MASKGPTTKPNSSKLKGDAFAPLAVGVGFGCYLAWCMMAASASLLHPEIQDAISYTAVNAPVERLSWLFFLALYGVWAYIQQGRSAFRRSVALAISLSVSAGTALCFYYVLHLSVAPSFATELLMLASSVYIALWGELLCGLKGKNALVSILVASIVSFVVVLVMALMPAFVQIGCQICLPAASSVLLVLCCSKGMWGTDGSSRGEEASAPRLEVQVTGFELLKNKGNQAVLRSFLGIGLFGATVVLLQFLSEAKTTQPNELLWIIAGLAVDIPLLVLTLIRKEEIKASFFSRFILPLLVMSVFLVFAADAEQQAIEVFFIGVAWIYLKLFTWIIWRLGALKASIPAASTIVLGQVVLTAGTSVGSLLYDLMSQGSFSQLSIMAFVCVFSIGVAIFLLDTRFVSDLAQEVVVFDPENRAMCERRIDKATEVNGLSGQERVIALMLVQGDTNEEMLEKLVVTNSTLRTHLRNMYKKTATHSREELVLYLRSLV